MPLFVQEKDGETTSSFEFSECTDHSVRCSSRSYSKSPNVRASLNHLLSNLFLPAGYPHSVSPDYLHYQIWNAIQACCSSLAGLLASRAVLEGFGVGNASASATDAMLVTVIQDVFSRLTTIISAYYLGTSLFPEAKTYRLLADFLNDLALVFDVISPHLDDLMCWFTSYHFGSGLRITALCISGCLRALCGVVAGGSKTALTLHFAASSANGTGDIGDLNAKDGSKETVLVLLGLLVGTALLPHVSTVQSTYIVLLSLLMCHLGANYVAVRGLALRTLNRQRATIAWTRFRGDKSHFDGMTSLTPYQISLQERIFENPACLRGGHSGVIIGPPNARRGLLFTLDIPIHNNLKIFAQERYILWCDIRGTKRRPITITIALKEGHSPIDHLKAWVHASEVARICGEQRTKGESDGVVTLIREAYAIVEETFATFVGHMRSVGWRIDEGAIVVGLSATVIVNQVEDSANNASRVEK